MSIDLPKVTVVTVVRNAESLIEETIQSTLAQDYPNVEYVIVDGDSSDGTKQIIQTYGDRIDRYVSEPDPGIYDAMNKAARLASGDWVIYMNAGDRFYSPNSLSQLESALRSHADVVFAGIAEILVDELETRIYQKMPRPIENIWYQMPTSHQATLVRLKHIQSYQFDTRYRWCTDHDM
ncbi:MAG: glycosyltransferase family 2 protein, partial [Cyanobacteria bacterium J06638_22]